MLANKNYNGLFSCTKRFTFYKILFDCAFSLLCGVLYCNNLGGAKLILITRMLKLRRSKIWIRAAYNDDHKKGQVWATTNERFGCDFHNFNHLTKLLFCLHYCISSDCSLTMSVKTSDPKAYFTIKNMASQICCFLLFLFFIFILHGGWGKGGATVIKWWWSIYLLWLLSFDHVVQGGWWLASTKP